jgi:hypothetical protein
VTEDKKHSRVLQQLVDPGEATPPAEFGMPDLAPTVTSLSDLLLEDRVHERRS